MAGERNVEGSPAQRYEARLALRGQEPSFNDDGVDLTQIRAALARTPLERLLHLEASVSSLSWMLNSAVRVRRADEDGR